MRMLVCFQELADELDKHHNIFLFLVNCLFILFFFEIFWSNVKIFCCSFQFYHKRKFLMKSFLWTVIVMIEIVYLQ